MSFSDFQSFEHSNEDAAHRVYFNGSGPPIIIMHELPGLTYESFEFAERLILAGFTTYLPHMFGRLNKKNSILNLTKLCISREFKIFARNETSPVVNWLRSLSNFLQAEYTGKGVGAIGMCITGSFAIPLLINSPVIAPVVSQPAAPIQSAGNMLGFHKRSFGISKADLEAAKEKIDRNNIQINIYRFKLDKLSPAEKVEAFIKYFGNNHVNYYELDSANPCHSVFVHDFNEEPKETQKALDDLIEYFKLHLK